MLAYCKWIKKLAEKITKLHVLDPAYDVNDHDSYMLITHDHVDITEFTTKLGLVSVHQAFYQPQFTQLEQVEIEMATNSES